MGTQTRIKGLAALLLLGSLALPQSTCAGYRAPDGKFVATIPRDAAPGTYQPMVQRDYAFDEFRVTEFGSWLRIAEFVWPGRIPYHHHAQPLRAPTRILLRS